MSNAAQKRAIQNYRARLTQRGLTRFEIMALESDRELIRTLARRLTKEGPEAEKVRSAVKTAVAGKPPKPGNILSALRRSPLVGADLDLSRPRAYQQRAQCRRQGALSHWHSPGHHVRTAGRSRTRSVQAA